MDPLRSMTGYGVARGACLGGRLTVEIRSLNHKYCDVRARLPRDLSGLEPQIIGSVKATINRGHVEVAVRWEERPTDRDQVELDVGLARSYLRAYDRLRRELSLPGEIDLALIAQHEVVTARDLTEELEKVWSDLDPVLSAGLAACQEMRAREGEALRTDLLSRCANLDGQRAQAVRLAPDALAHLQRRWRERVTELAAEMAVDPARMTQELAFLAERTDIAEELQRLRSHLEQVGELVRQGGSVGRKLDFLCQELLREINTVGSKSQSLELTRLVVDFKAELEKLREQVQNVE